MECLGKAPVEFYTSPYGTKKTARPAGGAKALSAPCMLRR